MDIVTRDVTTRLSKSKHIFLRENPQFKNLFRKLQRLNIRTVDDIRDEKIKNKIKKIMIETEILWRFNYDEIPHLVFSNHQPYQGDFEEAIPKILKELSRL